MGPGNSQLIDVFPINVAVFGLRAKWYDEFAPLMLQPGYLLITLLLVISMGIMTLRRFETVDLEKKTWNIPVILVVMIIWPSIVYGLKTIVDTFNTFLVREAFKVSWVDFGWGPGLFDSASGAKWTMETGLRMFPILAYWILYAFYLVFFFFYAVLGPIVLAKGVLFDEIEAFLELVKELAILLLWQTVFVIVTCLLLPDIVTGKGMPGDDTIVFKALLLGIMIFFVPTFARKFGAHLGQAFVPLGLRWGGAALGISAAGRVGGGILAAAGAPVKGHGAIAMAKENFDRAEEFKNRYQNEKHIQDMTTERRVLEGKIIEGHQEEKKRQEEHQRQKTEVRKSSEASEQARDNSATLVDLSKQAKNQMAPKGPS